MGLELDGAVVVVTGAAGGIGAALGRRLRRGGRGGGGHRPSRPGRRRRSRRHRPRRHPSGVRRARATRGRLDVVVANAGIGVGGLVEDVTADDWTRSIDVNIRGTVNTVQAAYPILREQRRGAIVAMASLAGLAGLPLLTPYAMTKYAVVGLAESLRPEAARYGIGVTAVCPGPVETPLLRRGGGHRRAQRAALPHREARGSRSRRRALGRPGGRRGAARPCVRDPRSGRLAVEAQPGDARTRWRR